MASNYVQANIVPEVFGEMTMEKIGQNLLLGNIATELGLGEFREVGDSVTFPMWLNDGEAIDLKKGDSIPTSEMKQKSAKAEVKHKAFGRIIYDAVDLTILGKSIDAVQKNIASVFAKTIETEIYKECLTSPLKSAVADAKKITSDELMNGLQLFGDSRNVTDFAGIYINSLSLPSFYAMNEFVSADKTYNVGGNGVVTNNCIGYFVGIPVFLSDILMDNNECTTLIIKKDSLAKMTKKDLDVEVTRNASKKATEVYTDLMFAVKNVNDNGIVVLRKTIA